VITALASITVLAFITEAVLFTSLIKVVRDSRDVLRSVTLWSNWIGVVSANKGGELLSKDRHK
jgi:hypothetical protein